MICISLQENECSIKIEACHLHECEIIIQGVPKRQDANSALNLNHFTKKMHKIFIDTQSRVN